MSILVRGRGFGFADWRAASRSGIAYTLSVFVFAFAVGTIRVTLVAPRLGTLLAVVLEAPIVLVVSWRVSLWCNRHFNVRSDPRVRALMGAVAFSFLMLLELSVAVLVFGEPLDHYLAKFASTPGIIGLAMQVCFAAIPWVQCYLRFGICSIPPCEVHGECVPSRAATPDQGEKFLARGVGIAERPDHGRGDHF